MNKKELEEAIRKTILAGERDGDYASTTARRIITHVDQYIADNAPPPTPHYQAECVICGSQHQHHDSDACEAGRFVSKDDLDKSMQYHVGRSWDGPAHLERDCECPKAPCGLVNLSEATCDQHRLGGGKTMRSVHATEACRGPNHYKKT